MTTHNPKQTSQTLASLFILIGLSTPGFLIADTTSSWNIRPYLGYSQLSDSKGQSENVSGASGLTDVGNESGFTAGLGVGYQLNQRIQFEFAGEYRSNDSKTLLSDGQNFNSGNYASLTFYLNGTYFFTPIKRIKPYVGTGIGWIQEIDIDLERAGMQEQSFENDGYAFQIFSGVDYKITKDWAFNFEIRHTRAQSVDLNSPQGSGKISGLDYNPTTLQTGVRYQF